MNTAQENKAIVRRFNKEFIEQDNINAYEQIIAADFINHTAPEGAPKTGEGVLYFFRHFLRAAFPDLIVEIHDQVAEDDKVTTRKTFHATHKNEFMGIPATEKKIKMEVIDIVRLRDGKFIEHWGVLDWQHVITQLTA